MLTFSVPGLCLCPVHTEKVGREGGRGNLQQASDQGQQNHDQVDFLSESFRRRPGFQLSVAGGASRKARLQVQETQELAR